MSSEKKVSLILAFKTKPALERLAEQFVSYWMRYVLGKKYVETLKHCWEVKWIKRKYLFVIEKDSIQHIFSFHVKDITWAFSPDNPTVASNFQVLISCLLFIMQLEWESSVHSCLVN